MKRYVTISLAVGGVVTPLIGCSDRVERFNADTEEADFGYAQSPAEDEHVSVTCEGIENTIIRAELSRRGLGQSFGEPDSVRGGSEPNRHIEGAEDSVFGVWYPALIVSLRSPAGAHDMAEHVAVTASGYVALPGLDVGSSEQQVIATLGTPTDRSGAALVYDCGVGAEQPVTFHMESGSVRRITIQYYVD